MKSLLQFIKFGIVGVSNTIIGYLIYAGSLYLMRLFNIWPTIDIYIAQFLMFMLSVAWSFFWNNKFVFKKSHDSKRSIAVALLKTYLSYAFTSLLLSELLLLLWVKCFGINDYIAPVLSLIITVPLNFIIQKFWVFKEKHEIKMEKNSNED